MNSNSLSFDQIGKPYLIADGLFTEGPVWNKKEGYILLVILGVLYIS